MEAFAALSLASAVVQFVDFGSRLVSKTNNLRENGFSKEVTDIKAAATTLSRLSDELKASFPATSPEEKEMKELAARCKDLAEQLLVVMKKIEKDVSVQQTAWRSFRQAIRMVMSKDEVKELTERIGLIRETMNLCLQKMLWYVLRNRRVDA